MAGNNNYNYLFFASDRGLLWWSQERICYFSDKLIVWLDTYWVGRGINLGGDIPKERLRRKNERIYPNKKSKS